MALNTVDQNRIVVEHHNKQWIRAVLSKLQDKAAIWAASAIEQFMDGGISFNGNWGTFREQFKARFETVNEVVDAKERLHVL